MYKFLLGRTKTKTGSLQCLLVTGQGEMGTNLNTGHFIELKKMFSYHEDS